MSTATLGRDDLARYAFEPDFFDANPALSNLREQIIACRTAYRGDAAKSPCRCGGNPHLILGCLEALLAQLETLRTENPEALTQFIAYIGAKQQKTIRAVTIYYRATAQTPPRKIRLP